MKQRLLILCLFAGMFILPARNISACGYYYSNDTYIDSIDPYRSFLNFHAELDLIARERGDLYKVFPKISDGHPTMNAEEFDFVARLKELRPDISQDELAALTTAYLKDAALVRGKDDDGRELVQLPHGMEEFTLYLQGWREMREQSLPEPKVPIEFKRVIGTMPTDVLSNLIEEFEQYKPGRWNYYNPLFHILKTDGDLALFLRYREFLHDDSVANKTIPSWEKLLELPEEQRRFRTVWVYYMRHDYQAVRKAADSGNFIDTAGLAWNSYMLEVRDSPDLAARFHAAYEADIRHVFVPGRHWANLIRHAANLPYDDIKVFLQDELIREIIAASLFSKECFYWSSHPDYNSHLYSVLQGMTFKNAERLAFAAYNFGHFDTAEALLKQQKNPGLLYFWIMAKLARHKGEYDEASYYLRKWLEHVKTISPNSPEGKEVELAMSTHDVDGPSYINDVYGQLGGVLVHKKDFIEALHCFCLAGSWEDIRLLVSSYISLEDLKAYIDTVFPMPKNAEHTKLVQGFYAKYPQLKTDEKTSAGKIPEKTAQYGKPDYDPGYLYSLFAEKAFREDRVDLAIEYSQSRFHEYIFYYTFLYDSKNTSLSRDARALALYNAMKIMRFEGFGLFGNSYDVIAHNNFIGDFDAYLTCADCKTDPAAATPAYYILCAKHLYCGAKAHNNQWYISRYIAAQMAIEAGELAEDRDLKALIHYTGGIWVGPKSADDADILYKRLVWKSWGTPFAKLADQVRWFPTPYNAPRKKETMRKFFHTVTSSVGLKIVSPPKHEAMYPNLNLLYETTQNTNSLNSTWDAKELLKNALEK